MKLQFNPGDISNPSAWNDCLKSLHCRAAMADELVINLDQLTAIDLAHFNSLLMVYTQFRWMGKKLTYKNCQLKELRNLIDKTNFTHVFIH